MQHYNYFQYQKESKKFEKPDKALILGNTFPDEYVGYKNYRPMMPTNLNEREMLMWDIQKYFFVCNDLSLYLDLHPTDVEALNYYRENLENLNRVTEIFESNYYPLCKTSMEIVKRPWPWLNNWEASK